MEGVRRRELGGDAKVQSCLKAVEPQIDGQALGRQGRCEEAKNVSRKILKTLKNSVSLNICNSDSACQTSTFPTC